MESALSIRRRGTPLHHHLPRRSRAWRSCRTHKTLRVTPAMAAGLSDTVHDLDWVVGLIDADTPAPNPRGPYKKGPPLKPI